MKKIFKFRTGGMFHGTIYIICANNKREAIDIIKEQKDKIISIDEIDEIELKESGIIASGSFHWLYNE